MKNKILVSECNDIKFLRDAVISLWQIIDDIDTCGDMAKDNDRFFRNLVEAKQAERWNLGITADGYNLYISDDSENIGDAQWEDIQRCPLWLEYCEYRCKPTTININGHDVPEPVREPLAIDTSYYVPDVIHPSMYLKSYWHADEIDTMRLNSGMIHLSKESAMEHSEALISFTRNKK